MTLLHLKSPVVDVLPRTRCNETLAPTTPDPEKATCPKCKADWTEERALEAARRLGAPRWGKTLG